MISVDGDLAEFIGAFIGDGFMGKYGRGRIIQIIGHKIKERDYFENVLSPLIEKKFSISPTLRVRGRGLRLTCYSKRMYENMLDMGLPSGKKCQSIEIPQFLLKKSLLTRKVIREYLW